MFVDVLILLVAGAIKGRRSEWFTRQWNKKRDVDATSTEFSTSSGNTFLITRNAPMIHCQSNYVSSRRLSKSPNRIKLRNIYCVSKFDISFFFSWNSKVLFSASFSERGKVETNSISGPWFQHQKSLFVLCKLFDFRRATRGGSESINNKTRNRAPSGGKWSIADEDKRRPFKLR